MERKIYYYIIALGLSAIFIYAILCIFIFKELGLPIYPTENLKNILAILILVYEVIHSKKAFRLILFALLPVFIIGFLFKIMHWPLGALLFFLSFAIILMLLFVNAIIKKEKRFDKIMILIFPLSHIIYLLTPVYKLGEIWWTIDLCAIGVSAIFLWIRLKKPSL